MVNTTFDPFPILTTPRLRLRQLAPTDAPAIYALRSDERVNYYIDRPKAMTLAEAESFIDYINYNINNQKWLYWAITLPPEDQVVGTICLWNIEEEEGVSDLGYELLPDFQGKGIMREALLKVLEFSFQTMRLNTIVAYTHRLNAASTGLLTRCGFSKDETVEADEQVRYVINGLR